MKTKSIFIYTILFFLIALLFYRYLIICNVTTDFPQHIDSAIDYLTRGGFSPNYLLYFFINLFAFFKADYPSIIRGLIFSLSLASTVKFYAYTKIAEITNSKISIIPLFVLTILLFIVNPIYVNLPFYYSGKLLTNIFHNTSLLYVLPFSLLLFIHTLQYSLTQKTKYLYLSIIWIVISTFIKPSFNLCVCAAFPLLNLYQFKFTKPFFKSVIVPICILLSLGIFYYFQYKFPNAQDIKVYNGAKSGIGLMPFAVWHNLTKHIIISLIASIAFPLVYLIITLKKSIKNIPLIYAWLLYIMGLCVFIFIAETGPRFMHANFIWQMIICSGILFTISLYNNISDYIKTKKNIYLIPLSIFCLHCISGVLYLINIFKLGSTWDF